MSISTYNELQAAIASWLDRDDLTARTPDFIRLAEARMSRELKIRELESRSQSEISDRYVDLPADFQDIRRVHLITDPITVLESVSPDAMITRYYRTGTGRPRFYTIHSQLELNVVPDDPYTMEMVYFRSLTPLASGTACNVVLQNHPDLYLYASLVETSPFIGDDPRLQEWESMYHQRMTAANTIADRARHGSGMTIRNA